ncbi:MAG: hypothetical protein RL687_32 [Candidatus Parcubacteria bacterium]|jgi:hypothetical protein
MNKILLAKSRMNHPLSSICTLSNGKQVDGEKFIVDLPEEYLTIVDEKPTMVIPIKQHFLRLNETDQKKKLKSLIFHSNEKAKNFDFAILVLPMRYPKSLHSMVSSFCLKNEYAFVDSSNSQEKKELLISLPTPQKPEIDLVSMFHFGIHNKSGYQNRLAFAKV